MSRKQTIGKRTLCTLLPLLLCAALFPACQPTPEAPIVVQKNQENLLQAASQPAPENSDASLRERTSSPAEYSDTIIGDHLEICVAAEVIIPDCTSVPIIRAEAADFSQDVVTTFFDALCGDAIMWKIASEMSKDEIEDAILDMQKSMLYAKSEGDMELAEVYEAAIEAYQQRLESAPETVEEVRSDGTLEHLVEINKETGEIVGHYTGVSAVERLGGHTFGREFRVSNNSDRKESIVYQSSSSGGGGLPVRTGARMEFLANNAGALIYTENETPLGSGEWESDLAAGAGISVEEACGFVQQFLDRSEIPMKIKAVAITKDEDDAAYKISCARKIGDVSCAIIEGCSSGNTAEAYAPMWFYEHLDFWVNDSGILGVRWESPIKEKETVVTDCSLLSFADIAAIFSEMMPIIYDFDATLDAVGTITYRIDRIELELVRVADQNSLATGLLVPAWRFYGSKSGTDHAGLGFEEIGCYLTVNAVDGSVIDTTVGY